MKIDEETIKTWIVDEGIFRENKVDDDADFHFIVEFPRDNVMDIIKPKGKDSIIMVCATQVSPQHSELMMNAKQEIKDSFILKVNMELNRFLIDTQLAINQQTGLLQQFVITDQIFEDGLTKHALFSSLKRVFKAKLQCVWLIDKTFGNISHKSEPSNENSMFI